MTAGGFGKNKATREPRALTVQRSVIPEHSGTIGVPITRLPMGGCRPLIRAAFLATRKRAGGRHGRVLINSQLK